MPTTKMPKMKTNYTKAEIIEQNKELGKFTLKLIDERDYWKNIAEDNKDDYHDLLCVVMNGEDLEEIAEYHSSNMTFRAHGVKTAREMVRELYRNES